MAMFCTIFPSLENRNLRYISSQAFERSIRELIHHRAVKVHGLHGTLAARPERRRAERHIFEGRALKRSILECRLVKLDAEKSLPIKSQSAQIGSGEVHANKATAFKGRFSQVGIFEVDIRQLDADELCSNQPRRVEVGAHKDGFTEGRIHKVKGGEVAIGQIGASKSGFTDITAPKRAAGQVCTRKVRAAQRARLKISFLRDNARKVALWQITCTQVDGHLPRKLAGEVGNLLDGLLNVADTLNGHAKGCFIILALGFEFPEPLLQIGEQIRL